MNGALSIRNAAESWREKLINKQDLPVHLLEWDYSYLDLRSILQRYIRIMYTTVGFKFDIVKICSSIQTVWSSDLNFLYNVAICPLYMVI